MMKVLISLAEGCKQQRIQRVQTEAAQSPYSIPLGSKGPNNEILWFRIVVV